MSAEQGPDDLDIEIATARAAMAATVERTIKVIRVTNSVLEQLASQISAHQVRLAQLEHDVLAGLVTTTIPPEAR